MKKGFTLLELIVVIIILGILATLGFTQYGRMVERSRGAEARAILGDLRKLAGSYYLEHGTLQYFDTFALNANLGASGENDVIPSICKPSHYFSYSVNVLTPSSLTMTATRCTVGGKPPSFTVVGGAALTLTSDIASGVDTWTSSAVNY